MESQHSVGGAMPATRSSIEQRMRTFANVDSPLMAMLTAFQARLHCCCFDIEVDGAEATILGSWERGWLNPVLRPAHC